MSSQRNPRHQSRPSEQHSGEHGHGIVARKVPWKIAPRTLVYLLLHTLHGELGQVVSARALQAAGYMVSSLAILVATNAFLTGFGVVRLTCSVEVTGAECSAIGISLLWPETMRWRHCSRFVFLIYMFQLHQFGCFIYRLSGCDQTTVRATECRPTQVHEVIISASNCPCSA